MLFKEWLTRQYKRDDTIGELARRLWDDMRGPVSSNNPDNYRDYLAAQDYAKVMMAVLEEALEEWRADEEQGRE